MPPPAEPELPVKCRTCGQVIDKRGNFCPQCGHALPSLKSVLLNKSWMSRGSQ